MRILMLTPYLPYPPSSGGQVRSYNLIKQLYKKHDITLFCYIRDEAEKKYVAELTKYCKEVKVFKRRRAWSMINVLLSGATPYPFLVAIYLLPSFRRAVKEELKKQPYDLIHSETFYVMTNIPKTTVPILLVEQTIEYQVYQHYLDSFRIFPLKPFLYLDVFKLKFWESRFWKKAKRVIAMSESDKAKMLSLVPNLHVDIVPNGAGEDLVNLWGKRRSITTPIILYQGNFNWLQNTEAAKILAKDIFPLIKKEIPEAVCWIVGQGVKEKIGDLAGNGIEIHELKSSDIDGVRRAYGNATIFVAPLAGPGGTRLKILGAMAAGVPVVTTSIGIEGISAENNQEVLVRDAPEEMAKAAISLIKDKKFYANITSSARRLFEEKYNWTKIAEHLDNIYREVGGEY
ncbi:glycosyltransferase [Candidatus Microgenomates bacterium]|nr:glycosyltransferase [Candidatus Microgenomates bacterium]